MKFYLTVFICLTSTVLLAQFNLPKDLSEEIGFVIQLDSMDVDQDGDLDILVTSQDKIYWYRNASGVFELEQRVIFTNLLFTLSNVRLSDIDNDGDLDILFVHLVSSGNFKIKKIENLGSGTFSSAAIIPLDFGTFSNPGIYFQLGDIDNDGNVDIVQTQSTSYSIQIDKQLNWAKGNGNGSFMPLVLLDSAPHSFFKLMDFDIDGDLDIFYHNANKLTVQQNLGVAQFAPVDTIALINTILIQFVDLNGDNYPDLNVVSSISGLGNTPIYSLINNAGVFGSPTLIPTNSLEITCINHGDFDDDGDDDVLVNYAGTTTQFGTSSFGWYENNGFGSLGNFQEIDGYALGIGSNAVGDFNGDGKDDIIAALGCSYYGQDQVIALYPYTSSGIQAPYTPIAEQADQVYAINSTDVDLDGLVDVVITSNKDKTISWHKNLGGNNWGPMTIISEHATTNYAVGSQSSVVIDLDNDGDDDIISSSYLDANLVYYENLGGGIFSNEVILSTNYPNIIKLSTADFNNDGFDDLMIYTGGTNGEIVWLENSGVGTLTTEYFITNSYSTPFVSDLDQDGNLDIIGITTGSIKWSRNSGGGTFNPPVTLTSYTLPSSNSISVKDMNNDGELDLVIGSVYTWTGLGRITIAYNNGGSTSFSNEILQTFTGFYPKGICVEDFDLDGDNDIFHIINTGQASLLENLGNGQFSSIAYPASTRAYSNVSEAVDYDNDGDLDLFIGNGGSGISVLENLAFSPLKASGKIYVDLNQNGTFDGNDFGTDQFGISSTFNDAIIELNTNGNYHLVYNDSAFGTYQSEPVLASSWGITSNPSSYQQVINGAYVNQTNNDFGVYPTIFENNVAVDFTGGFAGCTDLVNLWVATSNESTTRPNANFELTLASGLTYATSSFTPDSIVGQSIYWHADSLLYFSDSVFTVQVATPNASFAGDTLVSSLITNVNDATGSTPQTIVNSFTQIINCIVPITHKSGKPYGSSVYSVDEYIDPNTSSMEYLIRFQNSTPSFAEYLKIQDNLDTNLVWSSIEVVSASHPCTFYVNENQQKVFFEFDHIHLPNISSNYIGSKGYIKYKIDIKPNRPFPTVIKNSCTPIFDITASQLSNITYHKIYNCDSTITTANLITENCIDEVITGNISENVTSTDKVWTIPNIYTDLGNNFYWNADTAGTFTVNLTITNEYCSADTNFTVTIHPKYNTPADSLAICDGDSVQIYGQFTSTPGIYFDSLQSIYGCDSIVSKELFEIPLPNVSFYSLITLTCVNYAPIPLTNASPPNGQFVGPGIVGSTFDPNIAGVGVHTLFYHYTSSAGCSSSDSIQIVVDGCAETPEISDDPYLLTSYNPDNKEITLSITETTERNYSYGIYDMSGKLIVEDHLNSNSPKKIDTQAFESGVYFVLLKESGIGSNYHFRKIYLY